MNKIYRPVVLVIIDGFGVPEEKSISTWEAASQPKFAELEKYFPFTTLQASGIAVGLPWGEPGNSEVGHLTIGAGKIIHNYLPRISSAIKDGSFFQNDAFIKSIDHIKRPVARCISWGYILLELSTLILNTYMPCLTWPNKIICRLISTFLPTAKTLTKRGGDFYSELEKIWRKNYPGIKIASIIGRGYAMDRNGDWGKPRKPMNFLPRAKEILLTPLPNT